MPDPYRGLSPSSPTWCSAKSNAHGSRLRARRGAPLGATRETAALASRYWVCGIRLQPDVLRRMVAKSVWRRLLDSIDDGNVNWTSL